MQPPRPRRIALTRAFPESWALYVFEEEDQRYQLLQQVFVACVRGVERPKREQKGRRVCLLCSFRRGCSEDVQMQCAKFAVCDEVDLVLITSIEPTRRNRPIIARKAHLWPCEWSLLRPTSPPNVGKIGRNWYWFKPVPDMTRNSVAGGKIHFAAGQKSRNFGQKIAQNFAIVCQIC